MFLATVCGKPDCSCFDFSRESCFYTGTWELHILLAEQVVGGSFYSLREGKGQEENIVSGGWCRWRVEDEAVDHATEVQREVTSGALATSGAPQGDPRVLQIWTGRQQPASRLADYTEQIKIYHPPGHHILSLRCPAYHRLLGYRVLEHKIIGSWWSLNYSCVLSLNSL